MLIRVCVVLAALAETASALLSSELTDNALQSGSLSAFWAPAGMWLAAALLGAFVGHLGNSLADWTAERLVMRMREKVFAHVQILPPDFFSRHRTGDLVERLTGDVLTQAHNRRRAEERRLRREARAWMRASVTGAASASSTNSSSRSSRRSACLS